MEENRRAEDDSSQWKYGVSWKNYLETEHEAIDGQHKELFRLTSDLVEACENGSNLEMVGKALEFLASYTLSHFADEEALMMQNNFPGYEEHKKMHENFRQTVKELMGRYQESGNTSELSREVNSVVVQWLISHISKVDRKLANFTKSIQTSQSEGCQ